MNMCVCVGGGGGGGGGGAPSWHNRFWCLISPQTPPERFYNTNTLYKNIVKLSWLLHSLSLSPYSFIIFFLDDLYDNTQTILSLSQLVLPCFHY